MPPPPDRLARVAELALDTIVAAYTAGPYELPDRRYVSDGTAVYDCAQLTVQVERIYSVQGSTAEVVADANCLGMRAASLAITTLRCVPSLSSSGQPPSAQRIHASATEGMVLQDPTIQWNALRQAYKSGALDPLGHGLAFEAWQGIGPDGGLAGGTMRVRWLLVAGPEPAP